MFHDMEDLPMTTNEQVDAFLTGCQRLGFRVSVKPGMVSVRASFEPGDRAAYSRCDGDGPSLLSMVPTVALGSTWGTDGASVGGAVGLAGGYYRLSRSGVSKRFCLALAKVMAT